MQPSKPQLRVEVDVVHRINLCVRAVAPSEEQSPCRRQKIKQAYSGARSSFTSSKKLESKVFAGVLYVGDGAATFYRSNCIASLVREATLRRRNMRARALHNMTRKHPVTSQNESRS